MPERKRLRSYKRARGKPAAVSASAKKTGPKKAAAAPPDVAAIRREIRRLLDVKAPNGRKVGDAKFGVYAFYDYDGEPIYVGETREMLRSRIGRHLTGQRSDPVAKFVLDPFEVADIEMWPLFDLQDKDKKDPEARKTLGRAEYTLYRKVVRESRFNAVLNEEVPKKANLMKLPTSYRGQIIPAALYELRKHSDVRIARRASTIASLARVISERDVGKGLRRTLLTQAKRLQYLADERFSEVGGQIPVEEPGSETGEEDA
jgi:hypothetical protein